MSKLLINQPPLQVIPALAVKIGLNEAIILQQLHYWLGRSVNVREGRKWVYNDYGAWHEQFPFWSEKTVKRTFLALEKLGIVTSRQFEKYTSNYTKRNRRKWYTIDYDKFKELENEKLPRVSTNPERDKVGHSCEEDKLGRSTYTETVTENTSDWTAEDWPLIKVLGDEGYDPDTDSAIKLGRIAKDERISSDQLREALQELNKQKTHIDNPFGWVRSKIRELKSRDELYFQRVQRVPNKRPPH
jgi:hypothetical protein